MFKALLDFACRGTGNNLYDDHIFDLRVQRIDKYITKSPSANEFVPFFVTIRKSKIDKANEAMVNLQKSFRENTTLIQYHNAPALKVPLEDIAEKVKREQIALMFAPQLRNLKKG